MLRGTSLVWSVAGGLSLAVASVSPGSLLEWQFNGPSNISTGNDVAIDSARPGASTASTLMNNSNYDSGATNVGAGWASYLGTGFLNVPNDNANSGTGHLVTKDTAEFGSDAEYRDYSGGAGLANGMTFVAIVRRDLIGADFNPNFDVWRTRRHYILSAAPLGATGGELNLGTNDGTDDLVLRAGLGVESAKVTKVLDIGKWYFVAGSVGHDQNAVLYVREMDPTGPANSPAATANIGLVSPSSASMQQPEISPILLGTRHTFGGVADTWGGQIAYFGMTEGYTSGANSFANFDAMFDSFAVPEPGAIVLLGLVPLVARRRR